MVLRKSCSVKVLSFLYLLAFEVIYLIYLHITVEVKCSLVFVAQAVPELMNLLSSLLNARVTGLEEQHLTFEFIFI